MGMTGMRLNDDTACPLPGLAGKVVQFADFLKARGFRVFQSGVHDALRSLCEIHMDKADFLAAVRASLVTNDLEWNQFEGLFNQFWADILEDEKKKTEGKHRGKESQEPVPLLKEADAGHSATTEEAETKAWLEGIAYSPVSRIERKDLSSFDKSEIPVAQLALKKLVEPFQINVSRRSRRSHKKGRMDFPRMIRQSMKTEGIPMGLFYREKKKRLKRLVILADVSGSMDRYARFVMPFIMGMKGVGSRSEVFVFSTSLTRITFFVRHLSIEKALQRMAAEKSDWSGGTRIGYSLHQFNGEYGQALLNGRTVVVILSDGWDLGGKELLRREMETLNRKAHCVIWLNPLAGDPDYEPVCHGMRVALPHVDYFLPASSLQHLKRVGRLLSRLMIH